MIFTQSRSVFDTVSIAKRLPRGKAARETGERDAEKHEGDLMSGKAEGLEPIAMHDSKVVRPEF